MAGRNCLFALNIFRYYESYINTGGTMRKTIVLNCLPLTTKKKDILDSLFSEYLRVLNLTFAFLPDAHSSTELHHLTYATVRTSSFLPSDIVQEARKDVWAKRKRVKKGFRRCSIRLNKRWFKFFTTERGTPCFKITYAPRKTFVIPIKADNGYKRFNAFIKDDWKIKSVSLLKGQMAVSIEKEYPEPINNRRYIVGVDIGSTTLAAVTVLDSETGKTIKQLYFGRDVAKRQKSYLDRRRKLQSRADKGSERAKKSLKRLKHKQANFVKTRSGQIAKQIVNLAMSYNASIAIEKLNVRGRKGDFNRNANRKITHIPHAELRKFLITNSEQSGIPLDMIDAYHTSKWCPYCGSVNPGHSNTNYSLYMCKTCGSVLNSDRKASKVIAIKSALERELSQGLTNLFTQFSSAGVAVNQLFRPDDERFGGSVNYTNPPMESSLR